MNNKGEKMRKTRSLLCLLAILFVAHGLSFAEETVAQLKERIIDIQNQGKLGFRNFTLCSNTIGYGQYVSVPNNKVKAGTTVYFYYEPVNLYTNRRNGGYHIWYTQDIILTTEDGQELYRQGAGHSVESLIICLGKFIQ